MNRDLDGIYLRIKRNGKWLNICLSDMTEEELKENLKYKTQEFLLKATIHLALRLKEVGDALNL